MKVLTGPMSRMAAISLAAVITVFLVGCAQASPQQDGSQMDQDNSNTMVAAGLPALDAAAPKQVETATFAVG